MKSEELTIKRKKVHPVPFKLESEVASTLPEDVQNVLKELSNVEGMQQSIKNLWHAHSHGADKHYQSPLGRVSADGVEEASTVPAQAHFTIKFDEKNNPILSKV